MGNGVSNLLGDGGSVDASGDAGFVDANSIPELDELEIHDLNFNTDWARSLVLLLFAFIKCMHFVVQVFTTLLCCYCTLVMIS